MAGPDETASIAVAIGRLEANQARDGEKLDAIHESLKEDIAQVKEQTTATNGRVTALERRQAELRGIGIAVLALSPFVLWALQRLIH